MAVDADDGAAVGLRSEDLEAYAAPYERRDVRSLGAEMVELEDDWVGQAAVHAAARAEQREHEGLCLAHTARLEGVRARPMMLATLDVIRTEACAAPPL